MLSTVDTLKSTTNSTLSCKTRELVKGDLLTDVTRELHKWSPASCYWQLKFITTVELLTLIFIMFMCLSVISRTNPFICLLYQLLAIIHRMKHHSSGTMKFIEGQGALGIPSLSKLPHSQLKMTRTLWFSKSHLHAVLRRKKPLVESMASKSLATVSSVILFYKHVVTYKDWFPKGVPLTEDRVSNYSPIVGE